MDNSLESKISLLKSLRGPQQMIYYAVMPIGDLLLVLFVGLKLGEIGQVAHWSWVWVIAPFWIPVLGHLVKKFLVKVNKFMTINKKIEVDLGPDE
jgi:hypothetical protein